MPRLLSAQLPINDDYFPSRVWSWTLRVCLSGRRANSCARQPRSAENRNGDALLTIVSFTMASSTMATVANWIIMLLVVAHIVEVGIHFKLCRDAEGSLPWYMFNVLVFGLFHANELKAKRSAA